MYYEKYIANDRKWYWTLHGANHEPISRSGDGYNSEASCDHSIGLNKGSGSAPVKRR